MKQLSHSILALAFGASLVVASTSAFADLCDELQVLDNEQGSLSLEGYTFNLVEGDNRSLRALINSQGFCDSRVVISAPNPRWIESKKDDHASRVVVIEDQQVLDWETGKLVPGFFTRFQIEPETAIGLRNSRITFRKIHFSPPDYQSDEESIDLDFTLAALDNKTNWALSATMDSAYYGIHYDVPIAQIGPSNGTDRRIEVLVQYVYSDQVNASKLRISRFTKGSDQVLWETHLSSTMTPKRQSQGLLAVEMVPTRTLFKIENCLDSFCIKTLDQE